MRKSNTSEYIKKHHLKHKCLFCGKLINLIIKKKQTLYNYAYRNYVPVNCSLRCSAIKRFPLGKKHPAYKNGSGRGYNGNFRRKFVETSIMKCVKCNRTNVSLILHHIDRNPHNNVKSNIQILCNSCHLKLHNRERRKYPNYIYSSRKSYQKYISHIFLKKKREIKNNKIKKIFKLHFGNDYFYTAKDLCKKYNLTRERIRQMRNEKKLKFIKIGCGYFYPLNHRILK